MFSVVIPLYNKASYVEKAIKSVLNQTFSKFELIVVNDGSTDDSVGKIANLNDSRIQIIHQSNTGVSTARNKGVKQAKFTYLAFLDADDWWHERFLEEMNELITRFPEAGIYGSSYFLVKNGINKPAQVGVETDFKSGFIDYFSVYARTFWVPVNCSFVVVRKSIFDQENGFKPALKFGEDVDLWIRIALKHNVCYVNKYLAYSNQDVAFADRALGTGKFWQKAEHVIFNLEYLAEEEEKHPTLKLLLDGLRVRSLVDFYLNCWHSEEVQTIVDKVDWQNQPQFYQFVYQWPRAVVIAYYRAKQYGSFVKQSLLRYSRKLLLQ